LNFDYQSSGVEDAIKAQCGGFLLYAPGAESPEPLTEDQVTHIKNLAEEQNSPKTMADRYNFQVGQEVEIASGPLFGQKGRISEIKRATVIVDIACFGREEVRAEVAPNQCLTAE
jgi:transcription antitermination factor NusG